MKGRLVSESYGEVVLALGRAGLIGLVPTTNEKGTTVVDALRDRQSLVGGGIAPALETFLCERNGHVCSIEKTPQGKRSFSWRTTRELLNQPILSLSCDGAKLPNSVLCLPNLTVEKNDSSIGVIYNGRVDDLASIVNATGGCAKLDQECRRWTLMLNRQTGIDFSTFASTFAGTLVVPAKQYRLELSVGSAEQLDRIVRALDAAIATLRKRYEWPESQRFVYYTVQRPVAAQGALATDAPAQPPLSLMGYPYQNRGAFDAANFSPTVVGVWDRHVDDDHCSYGSGPNKAIMLADPLQDVESGDDQRFSRVPCFRDRTSGFSLKWDHATHVTGLIAGQGAADVLGANPKALIWSYEVSDERLQQEDPIADLARLGRYRLPDVINISMAETGIVGTSSSMLQSRLEALVRSQSNQNLFVIAAGNAPPGGQPLQFEIGGPCRIMPACISTEARDGRGVLSVVALDADGVSLLTGENASNFGTAFDVAAVGVAQSSFDGNFRGRMRGTSVATPFVSSLASLLYSKKGSRTLPPAVKDWILLTADFSEDWDEIVRFGRINYARALANLDTYTLVDAGPLCEPNCTSTGTVRTDPADQIEIQQGMLDGRTIANRPIKMVDLMRFSRTTPTSSTYYVVYRDDTGVLRKVRGATFNSQVLQFKKAGDNRFHPVDVTKLREYVCSFAHNAAAR